MIAYTHTYTSKLLVALILLHLSGLIIVQLWLYRELYRHMAVRSDVHTRRHHTYNDCSYHKSSFCGCVYSHTSFPRRPATVQVVSWWLIGCWEVCGIRIKIVVDSW